MINDKRAEALRKLQSVQRKVARLRREKGVEINGTQFDVRVPREKLKRYNSKQLDAFISRANQFTNRRTQFAALAKGVPVPSAKANQLLRKEARLNAKHEAIMGSIGKIQAPFSGMSIAEREQMRPTVRAGGEPFARTFEPVQTRLENVRSIQALDKLMQQRDRQLSPTYARKRVNSARDELDKMLTRTGQEFFKARVKALTDEQFFAMWEYGPTAGEVSLVYEIMKAQQEQGVYGDADQQMYEDLSYEINEAISWAEELPTDIDLGPLTNRRAPEGTRAQARGRAQKRRAR